MVVVAMVSCSKTATAGPQGVKETDCTTVSLHLIKLAGRPMCPRSVFLLVSATTVSSEIEWRSNRRERHGKSLKRLVENRLVARMATLLEREK